MRNMLLLLAVLAVPAHAQEAGARVGGPGDGMRTVITPDLLREFEFALSRTSTFTVRDAPYSGEGVTTTSNTLADGTRIQQTTRTRVWRDRMGRVRREQTTVGLGALSPSDTASTMTIEDPVAGVVITLDPANRTARSTQGAFRVRTPSANATLLRAGAESLGTRDMEGVRVVGWRTTRTIPAGQIGNDRPIVSTDERWESPELQVLVYSRQNDPRTGTVEYRLTNISRADPPAELFTVPAGYTANTPPGFGAGGGARTGGAGRGGRGGRSNTIDGPIPPPPQ